MKKKKYTPEYYFYEYLHDDGPCCDLEFSYLLITDLQKGKAYHVDESFDEKVIFYPNKKDFVTVVYDIEKKGSKTIKKKFIVTNNIEGKKYDDIHNLTLSPDGKKIIYVAEEKKQEFVVVDGKEGEKYDRIFSLKTHDNLLVYFARKGNEIWKVVENLNRLR